MKKYKRKLVVFVYSFFVAISLNGQNLGLVGTNDSIPSILQVFREIVQNQSPSHNQAFAKLRSDTLSVEASNSNYLPNLILSLQPFNLNKNSFPLDVISLSHIVGFKLSQNLPGSGSISVATESTLAHKLGSPYSNNTSFSLNLGLPLSLLTGSGWELVSMGIKNSELASHQSNLQFDYSSQLSFIDLFRKWGVLKLLYLRLETFQNNVTIYEVLIKEIEDLWKTGRRTLFDIQELELRKLQNFEQGLDLQSAIKSIETYLSFFEFPSALDISLDTVIHEIFTWAIENPFGLITNELTNLTLAQAQKQVAENILSRSPQISGSFSVRPNNAFASGETPWDAVYGFWNQTLEWDMALSLSLSLSVFPWDTNSLMTSSERAILEENHWKIMNNNLSLSQIKAEWENEKNSLMQKIIEAERRYSLEENRFIISQALAQGGRILSSEVLQQGSVLQKTSIDILEAKWNLIVFCLTPR